MKIIGMGKALPRRIVKNDELAKFLETSDEWIVSKTGIHARAVCVDETLTELAAAAARDALHAAEISAADIDLVLCATATGDYAMPSTACCVALEIGAKCAAFDMNAACTGFVYALDVADSYLRAGKAQSILIVCAEMMSRAVDWRDRASCILFGDGAAACVVTTGESLKYLRISAEPQIEPLFAENLRGNNPFSQSAPDTNTFLQMQGQHVYKFAVKTIENEIAAALSALNLDAGDIDFFVLHQANARIIEGARARLRLPPEKFPTNIQNYGNMSAASIPVLLCEMAEHGRVKKGDRLMLIGFGAGMTAGTAVMEW